MTPIQKFIATIVALVMLLAGAYIIFTIPAKAPTVNVPNGATTTPSQSKPILVTPDYKKPIVFLSSISTDIRAQLNSKLKVVQEQIEKNPLSIGAWVNLGTLHKMGGSYAIAAEYWEYITDTYVGSGVPYYSLGDLYQNFLHNNVKAEANYKLAVKVNPQNVNAYAGLYTLYRFNIKDTAKAADILIQGLAANPGNNYLLSLQQELK